MRWLPVLILGYIIVGIQAGIAGEIRFDGFGPNLGLLAVVFIAINAPREQALLACLVIGCMQDLGTQQAPGLYALSYGLTGWLIAPTQQIVNRGHPATHASLALVGGIITGLVLWIHGHIAPPLRLSLTKQLGSAVYTALLAPIVIGVLHQLRGLFGFHPLRRGRGAY